MTQQITDYIRHQVMINGSTNAFANGIIAWWLLKDGRAMEWWGDKSFAIDIMATGFLLPFIVALIVIPLQKRKITSGKLPILTLDKGDWPQRWLIPFPKSMFLTSLLFGSAGLFLFSPLTFAAFLILGIDSITPANYSIFKGVWAGLVASILVGPMIMIGLRAEKYPDIPSPHQQADETIKESH